MRIRATLTAIDQIETDCAVLTYFEDERPLKSMTGLMDWRLCGRLSKFILDEQIDGSFGEALLFPADRKMLSHKILLMGLGLEGSYTFENYSVTIRKILDALFKLKITEFVLTLPGLYGTDIDLALAATRFCEALSIRYRDDKAMFSAMNVTIVALPDQLKKINPILGNFEKKNRAEMGL